MNKSQIQQIAVVVLLIVFVFTWSATRKKAPRNVPPPAASSQAAPAAAAAPKEVPLSEQAPIRGGSVDRDPFQLPPKLKDAFRKRAQDKERERAAREAQLQQQRAAQQTGAAPARAETIPSLNLQGILWGTDKPQAIINRKILSVGDTIEQAEVLAVTKEGVTLMYNGREVQLKLPELGGRQQSSSR